MDDIPGEFAERLIAADVGTWSYDPRADRLHADPVFARLLGLSDADASGGPLAAVFAGVHPQDQERMTRAFETVIRTRLTFAAQFRVIGRDGIARTVVGRAHAELDASGRCARLPGILIDVSAQREAEARADRVLAGAAAADARFRAFFEHSAPFAAITEPDGTLVEANEGACEGCGFARSGVLGAHFAAGPWWTDDAGSRATVAAAIARARDGDIVRERIGWRCGAGVARHMELALRPVLDTDGRIVNLAATGLDVTDQVRMERRLQESEARYRLALDAADLGTWQITPERGLAVDERFARIFAGGAPGPIHLDHAADIVHVADRERVRAAVGRAMRLEDPAPYDEEYRVVHPGTGEVRWVQARGRSRIEPDAGRPRLVSFDGTIVDTTERRRMDDELRQLAEDLAEADRRKDEFLATLAHELRNPLAPISNALQILTHDRGPDARRTPAGDGAADEAIATLERQVLQMTRLVNDLMDVSRISRGRIELERLPVTIRQVFDATVEGSRPMIDAGGHELVVSLPEPALPLEADVTRLAQALVNLVHNAVKYSEPGSRVELRARRAGTRVEIDVLDEGIGIAADRIGDIFRMFVQVDGSTSRAQGGLGIGLALVERFVALHGGEVSVRSPGEGRGATFRISLPLSRIPVADPSTRAPSPPVDASAAAPRRVLVVDDNEDGARTWVTVLGMRGHAARAVHDGFSALAAFADFRPDTVLLDIGMPGMDGHETCRRLRALPGGERAHVVAVTGWGSSADRERSAAAGFDRHLVKPVRVAELFALFGELPAARNA